MQVSSSCHFSQRTSTHTAWHHPTLGSDRRQCPGISAACSCQEHSPFRHGLVRWPKISVRVLGCHSISNLHVHNAFHLLPFTLPMLPTVCMCFLPIIFQFCFLARTLDSRDMACFGMNPNLQSCRANSAVPVDIERACHFGTSHFVQGQPCLLA